MNDSQNRRQNRNRAVVNFMNLVVNVPKWTPFPAIGTKVTALGNSVIAVEQIVTIQEMDIKGYRQLKELNKLTMAQKGIEVAGPLSQYAKDINDLVLFNAVNFSFSDLLAKKDNTAEERNQLVYDRANSNLAALVAGGYGVTGVMLGAYQLLITNFVNTVGSPKDAEAVKVAATVALKNELKKGNGFVADLKRLMKPFKSTDADFFYAFMTTTKIVGVGVHKEYAVIRLVDNVTDEPIPAGTVNVVQQSITVKVSKLGYGRVKNAATGTVTLIIESPTYVAQTIPNFVMTGIKPGKACGEDDKSLVF